jgi:hypothetical protein
MCFLDNCKYCLACGHVFCDTCTTNRRIVPWIDTERPVRVCNYCFGHSKARPAISICDATSSLSIDIDKQSNKKIDEQHGSNGDSTSTVSSGEHLNDLCLSPTDIFDIEQPGAGRLLVIVECSFLSLQIYRMYTNRSSYYRYTNCSTCL